VGSGGLRCIKPLSNIEKNRLVFLIPRFPIPLTLRGDRRFSAAFQWFAAPVQAFGQRGKLDANTRF
ncbi:MAG: hypothetical protein OXU88_06285, partial [Gammaproteobacteria bacterium]|nr:hypothetical protein [Gammaproteobacteria bacterium]